MYYLLTIIMLLPTIKKECSQFLHESNNVPLLKNLSVKYNGFKRVKVRKKNKQDVFTESFNLAFPEHSNIFQRSVFANGENGFSLIDNNELEPFYIFPINGYKFMYNVEVKNSAMEYKELLDRFLVQVTKQATIEIFSEIIKKNYIYDNLELGIRSGSEIIFYGISYFYAIRKSLVDDYNQLC